MIHLDTGCSGMAMLQLTEIVFCVVIVVYLQFEGTTEVIKNPAPSMRKRTRCEVINGLSYQYIVSCPSGRY